MAKSLISIAILLASSVAAPPTLHAKKPKDPKAYTCMAVSYYGNRRIVAWQDFNPTGQPLGPSGGVVTEGIPAEIGIPVVLQLTDDVAAQATDLPKNCSPSKSEFQKYAYYTCEERWSDGPDRFSISGDGSRVNLTRTMPSGMTLQLGWSDNSSDGDPRVRQYAYADFRRDGISLGGTYPPALIFQLPRPWGQANSVRVDKQGRWIDPKTEVGEARIGKRVYREWSGANFVVVVRHQVLEELRKSEGDLVITAYSATTGVYAQETFPRDLHQQTEAKLKDGYRRLMAKQVDPVKHCKREMEEIGPPIILTH
ncbi:MAG: hypothetical protein ABL912_10245 [Novosphingobium sp.]